MLCPPAEDVMAAMADVVEVGMDMDMDMSMVEETVDISILLTALW